MVEQAGEIKQPISQLGQDFLGGVTQLKDRKVPVFVLGQ